MGNYIVDLQRVYKVITPTSSEVEIVEGVKLYKDLWTLYFKTGNKNMSISFKTYQESSFKLENSLRLDSSNRPFLRIPEGMVLGTGPIND